MLRADEYAITSTCTVDLPEGWVGTVPDDIAANVAEHFIEHGSAKPLITDDMVLTSIGNQVRADAEAEAAAEAAAKAAEAERIAAEVAAVQADIEAKAKAKAAKPKPAAAP